MDPNRSPIFVIGTGRSGTTLLRLMLCAHPRIYITHEASFYMMDAMFPRRAPRRELLEAYFETRFFKWLYVDPARVMADLPDPLPREQMGLGYAAIMREKAALYGKVRFGDKTPGHSMFLRRIYRDFPEAKVIRIVRDPRATVQSLQRMPFASASIRTCCNMLETERRLVRRYRDRMHTIRLEDLLADPRKVMGGVLDFVGEPWDDAVLDHPNHIPDAGDMPPQPWLDSAARDRTGPDEKWRKMPAHQIRLIERLARGSMREGGYQPAALDQEPGALSVWWEGVRQRPEAFRANWIALRIVLNARDPRRFDSPETYALFRRLNPNVWSMYPSLGGELLPAPPPRALPAGRTVEA